MKKFLILAAAAVVLAACGSKQYTYEDLVFDYPSLYKIDLPDNDINNSPDRHLFYVEDGLENSLDLLSVEIQREEPSALANADPEILSAYLAEKAFNEINVMALKDEESTFYEKPNSVDDVTVMVNPATGLLEAHTYAKGKWKGEDLLVEANSTTFDGRFTITMFAQAQTDSYLKTLVDVYRSVHLAE